MAHYVTSPVPHARIVSIDVSRARAFPGVHAVLTGDDIGQALSVGTLFDWPVLAGIACVSLAIGWRRLPRRDEAAEAAAALVEVEYEELPAVSNAACAGRRCADHPSRSRRVPVHGGRSTDSAAQEHAGVRELDQGQTPDIERALARADRVFEHVFTTPRQHQGNEPHGVQVWFEGDVLHVISTSKSPFALRSQLAYGDRATGGADRG